MQFNSKTKQRDEQGIVSLIVTIILMMVISLIVISFARTSRREQRDSLDRQLSTNAFYAAESGVNSVRKILDANPSLLTNDYTSSCTGPGSFADATSTLPPASQIKVPSGEIGGQGSNASYTCIFVKPTVTSIEHSLATEPYSFPLKRSGVGNLGQVDFYWDGGSAGNASYVNCPAMGSNPTSWPTSTCASGVLRLELTDNLANNYVYFIYPGISAADNIPYATAAAPTGKMYHAHCTSNGTPQQCHFQLSSLNTVVYARVSSLYSGYELSVQASGGQEFADAQIVVDSTGKAADVQRRIQVRYSMNDFGGPSKVIQSGASTCKKFSIDGNNVTDNGGCWSGPVGATLP